MKITLCSSAIFKDETYEIKEKLEKLGHEVFVYPEEVEMNGQKISVEKFYEIEKSDAILVLNFDRKDIKGYIGGNTFLEMGIAFYLGKKIYLWKNPSEKLPYYEEIMAMKPVIIDENPEKVR